MKVLRVYHGGRDPSHRARERALVAAGAEVTLVVPEVWDEGGGDRGRIVEDFPVHELAVTRSGDVNRHRYRDTAHLHRVIETVRPDLLDVHEEPFSLALRQWLQVSRAQRQGGLPTVCYTAQNLDKRFPPPFAQYELAAYRRLVGMYPCSRQAASVARGKGFGGQLTVLPLGLDASRLRAGDQTLDGRVELGFIGRLVPEKGLGDAVRVLHAVTKVRPARLRIIGRGPDLEEGLATARALGVEDSVEVVPWTSSAELAALYREMHLVLVPSRATATWVEQFGRVITEAQAAGAVVAGYRSGSIEEVAGPAAVLVEEGDWAALSTAAAALLIDLDEWTRRRAQGLRQVAGLDWPSVATRQLQFYGDVLARPAVTPATGRRAARAEFGTPARTPGFARPFAAPVLRENTAATRLVARVLDRATGT